MTANDPRPGGSRRGLRPTIVATGRRRTARKPGPNRGHYARTDMGTYIARMEIMTKHDTS